MANTNPRSDVILYKTSIDPDKNALVDNISDYLSSCINTGILECQYMKHGLDVTLKLAYPERWQNSTSYNYCSIYNKSSTGTTEPYSNCYYFITNIEVVSQNTIMLTLHMDTVNTLANASTVFLPSNFNSNTHIMREHRDRFVLPLSTGWDPTLGGKLWRKIDRVSEGTVPNKLKSTDVKFTNRYNYDWYLIYKSDTQETSAINTYLCASEQLQVGTPSHGTSKTFTYSDFATGYYYYFLIDDNEDGNMHGHTLGNNITKTTEIETVAYQPTLESREVRGYVFCRDGTNIKYSTLYGDKILLTETSAFSYGYWGDDNTNTTSSWSTTKWATIASIVTTQANMFRVSTTDYTDTVANSTALKSLINTTQNISIGTTTYLTNSIDEIDRSESTLVKIIKYPYCPVPYSVVTVSGVTAFYFGTDWEFSQGLLKYKYTNLPEVGFEDFATTSLNGALIETLVPSQLTVQSTKEISHESKLFNSDFRQDKLTYDSFSVPIDMENFTIPSTSSTTDGINIDISFKPTSTINSKFAFKFEPTVGTYTGDNDYPDLLVVTRNNEETILNSEYINYIKTGYNYDKKQQAIQAENAQRSAIMTTIGSVVGTAANLGGMLIGGPVAATSALGLGTSAVSGISNISNAWSSYNNLIESQNTAMAQKLATLQAQAASTSGSDDVDLMSYYCGNRLHYIVYEPTSEVKNALWHALDLTGYATNKYATPVVNSRIWYNFIQCEPVITWEDKIKPQNDWIEDLKSRYSQGVTVYHRQLVNDAYVYNFAQTNWENWETWITEGV